MLRLNRIRNCILCQDAIKCSFSSTSVSDPNLSVSNVSAAIEPTESTSTQQITDSKPNLKTAFDFVQQYLKTMSLEEYVKQSAFKRSSKFIRNYAFARASKYGLRSLIQEEQDILITAGVKLQDCCANKFHYLELIKAFGLPDHIVSWYKLTLLHSWFILVRLHSSMESTSYLYIRQVLLKRMWEDIDKRMIQLKQDYQIKGVDKAHRQMAYFYYQFMYELDEGLLGDDTVLASALWRNIYLEENFDPIHLNLLVRYIRANFSWLDTIDAGTILEEGVKWQPLAELFKD